MGQLIAATLMLCVLAVPLIFGLQRFGAFRPSVWKVLLTCFGVALLLELVHGQQTSYYIGYFIAAPLFLIGCIVLAASFLRKTRAEASAQASGVSETEEMKTCPHCAERIKAEAIVCRYCGRDLAAMSQPPRNEEPRRLDIDNLRELAKLTEAERRKQCWACRGEIPSCTICKAREEELKTYLNAFS